MNDKAKRIDRFMSDGDGQEEEEKNNYHHSPPSFSPLVAHVCVCTPAIERQEMCERLHFGGSVKINSCTSNKTHTHARVHGVALMHFCARGGGGGANVLHAMEWN